MSRLTDPNSVLTRFRIWLARKIDVKPAVGEAWCQGCDLSNGRTLIVPVDRWQDHVRRHEELPGTHYVTVAASWPPGQGPS